MTSAGAFFEAIKRGELEDVKKLAAEEPALLRAGVNGELSPLLLSVYHRKPIVTDWLLSQEIGPLTIWEAAAVGDSARADELIEENPALRDKHAADGFTPLGLAAFFGHVDMLTLLLEHGADPNLPAQNQMRVRPIHSAAANRRPDLALTMVKQLLKHGAEPNVAQQGGWTPLHQAAAHGNADLVQLLIDHGANPYTRSEDGRLPADLAHENGFDDMAAGLRP